MTAVHDDDPTEDWTAPGTFRVAPDVYRIPLPLPNDALRAVNVYAIVDGDGLTLIDSGWALDTAREQLVSALAAIDCGLGDVTRFLVTHVHRDHYTQAVAVRREFGSKVSLGVGERESLRLAGDPDVTPMELHFARLRRAGGAAVVARFESATQRDPSIWEEPDEWLTDGAHVALADRELIAVPTPGHTQGHLIFRDNDAGLVFAGDHVLPHITPSIGFEPAAALSPLGAYLESLRMVRWLPDARLFPAHGPIGDSVHRRVDELLQHHDRRLEEGFGAVNQGATTAYDAAQLLKWTRRGRTFDELDPFNQMLAVLETAAHLDILAARRRITATTVNGVTRYAQRSEQERKGRGLRLWR